MRRLNLIKITAISIALSLTFQPLAYANGLETQVGQTEESVEMQEDSISEYSYSVSEDENFIDGVMSNPDGYEKQGRGAGYDLQWTTVDGEKVMLDGSGKRFGVGVCQKVIDVSSYNGDINWTAVKQEGIDGAILRITSFAGGPMHEDDKFVRNLEGCRKVGMPFGVYMYSYATSTEDAAKEANYVVSLLKKYNVNPSELSYSVYYDLEGNSYTSGLTVAQNVAHVEMFVKILKENGYPVNVYSYTSYLNNNLNSPKIHEYVSWVAQYGQALTFKNNYYKGNYGWQYRSNGTVSGISGEVDVSCFAKFYGYDTQNTVDKPLGRDKSTTHLEYRANNKDVTWLPYVTEPNTAGTTGRSLPLYQLQIKLNNAPDSAVLSGEIEYEDDKIVYGNIGQDTLIGMEDMAMRRVKFDLSNVNQYDLEYRVHSANIGWQDWVRQGEYAGDISREIQAIEFRLVENENAVKIPNINYATHVQEFGWQSVKTNGEIAGTSGASKRLEAITIDISDSKYMGDVKYRTHIQDIGWQDWKSDGEVSGTSKQSKRLEAIQIKLTDELSEKLDVYYRVHAQNFGWMDWAKNGELAGTSGYGYRLEAIQICLAEKGSKVPGEVKTPFKQKFVKYQTHVQDIGWQSAKTDGEIAGTVGEKKRLEGITLALLDQRYSGGIRYSTHIQDIGWQGFKENGVLSGTTGQKKRLEAIKIQLTGEMAEHYDIYYRVHAQNFGWLGWAKNGQSAGTEGYAYRLEGIEVQIVEKGAKAPGDTNRCFFKK